MENINREHPDYIARKAMWKQYKDLYAGGEQLAAERVASTWCGVKRSRDEVYEERLRPSVLRELHRVDRGLVRGDADAAGTDAAVRGKRRGSEELLQPALGRLRPERDEPARVLPAALRGGAGLRAAVSWWWTSRRRAGRRRRGRKRMRAGDRGRTWWNTRRTKSSTGTTTRRADWTGW